MAEPVKHDTDLVALLVVASQDLHEQTPKLMSADRAAELGMSNLEYVLKQIAECDHKGIHRCILFTGSRCYGAPTEYSDVDWVVVLSEDVQNCLKQEADVICGEEYLQTTSNGPVRSINHDLDRRDVTYDNTGLLDCAIRLGPLNLICVSYEEQWSSWVKGTKQLKNAVKWGTSYDSLENAGPRTRQQAVFEFQRQWSRVNMRPRYRKRGYKLELFKEEIGSWKTKNRS